MTTPTVSAELPEAPQPVFDAQGFNDWVLRNLPDDTIIGNSAWWADHLTQWAQRFVKAVPAQVEALSAAQAGVPADAPLPLLVRDIAVDLNTTPIQVCKALSELGFGGHSVNMAVTPQMARSLRAHFATAPQPSPSPAPASLGGSMQFGGCPECGSRTCIARECLRTVSHKAQAIPGVQWQCGPQANGFTAAPSTPAPAQPGQEGEMTKCQKTREVLERLQQQEDGHNLNPFRPLLEKLMANKGSYTVTEIGQLKWVLDGFYGAARAAPQPAAVDAVDAARWRHFCERHYVTLLVKYFGNGCTNVTLEQAIAALDAERAALAAQREVKP